MLRAALHRGGFLLRDRETRAGRATNATLYLLNAVFVLAYVVSTYDLAAPYGAAIRALEVVLALAFLCEYVVRIASADTPRAEVTDPYAVVDLVAVLPVFVVGVGTDVGFLRGLSTLRVFRFLRLLVDEQQVLGRTVRRRTIRRLELSVTIFLIFFISTGFVYAVEAGENPEIANFGDAFYFTVIAVSTVGFGDIVPTTAAGRWVIVAAVLVGLILIPWQASRLRSLPAATDATCGRCGAAVSSDDRYCRRCGEPLTDDPREP